MNELSLCLTFLLLTLNSDLQYLDRVCQKDQQLCQAYHGPLVKLYAEFAPKKLLPFLKSSIHYPLQRAMEECEVRGLIPEQVYLLGE